MNTADADFLARTCPRLTHLIASLRTRHHSGALLPVAGRLLEYECVIESDDMDNFIPPESTIHLFRALTHCRKLTLRTNMITVALDAIWCMPAIEELDLYITCNAMPAKYTFGVVASAKIHTVRIRNMQLTTTLLEVIGGMFWWHQTKLRLVFDGCVICNINKGVAVALRLIPRLVSVEFRNMHGATADKAKYLRAQLQTPDRPDFQEIILGPIPNQPMQTRPQRPMRLSPYMETATKAMKTKLTFIPTMLTASNQSHSTRLHMLTHP